MVQSKSCEGCRQAHDCTKVYEQLGCAEGPSVTSTALLAFLLPVVVFVAALGGFGWLLKGVVAGAYLTPLAAALALVTTTGVVLVARVLTRLHRRK